MKEFKTFTSSLSSSTFEVRIFFHAIFVPHIIDTSDTSFSTLSFPETFSTKLSIETNEILRTFSPFLNVFETSLQYIVLTFLSSFAPPY